jgi:hypothetical protein
MDEIFNPSLIISLGPSSKKALLYTKKLLSNVPAAFLDLIDFYDVQDVSAVSKDIQEVIDTKLLSAKALNKLVDMGYKVRNENISYVRLNLYILWEVYESSASVLEVVKLLSNLNYGNIDNSQHSGVCLFVIPIFDKEWSNKEKNDTGAIEELIELKDYLCRTENMLKLDSKVFLLHSISNDGTRIPKEELRYISAIIVYSNLIPSKEPPLSSYIKRVLMHEGNYKIGTIGISSLMIFKDRLQSGFSLFLAGNIIKHALEYENITSLQEYKAISLINLHNETKAIMEKLSCVDNEGKLKLLNSKMGETALSKNILEYLELMKSWKEKIELSYVTELKEKVKNEARKGKDNIIKNIDEEIKEVSSKFSLKEGLNYLNSVLDHLNKDILKNKEYKEDRLITLNIKLQKQAKGCSNFTNYLIKGVLLVVILSIISIFFIVPHISGPLRIVIIIVFVLIGFALTFLDYKYNFKKLKLLIDEYKNEVLTTAGGLIKNYTENLILEEHEKLKLYILEQKTIVLSAMEALEIIKGGLYPLAFEEEFLGNLAIELLDSEDRFRLYVEKSQDFKKLYSVFIDKLGTYKDMGQENLKEKLLEFSSYTAKCLGDLDIYEYFKFKYKENSAAELSKWISKALVKARYLLQYVTTNLEEEHLFFVTSPGVLKLLKLPKENKFNNLKYSLIDSEHINTNCIAIVRICLGIDFDNIISFRRKTKGKE